MFSVRIVTTSHYQGKPIPGLDTTHSEFRNNAAIKHVPVLRIFGSTPAGQKTCMHVHGVFPYLYVPYDGTQPLDRYLRQFAASLDKALNVANRSTNSTIQHVYKITLVSGIPMYGYHSKEEHFLKIYIINPNNVRRAADLLLGGAVMNRPFQPHESHIPYPLQLFIDYNLYGMNLVNVAALKFRKRGKDGKDAPQGCRSGTDNLLKGETTLDRSLLSVTSSSSSPASSPLDRIWNEENIPSEMWLPASIERQSTCELEVDVVAADITNRQDLANNRGANPGLAALWEDERQRRRDMGESSELGPDSSQERVGVVPSDSEAELLKRFLDIVQQQQEFRSSQSVESTSCPPSQSASQLESHVSREDSLADSQSTVIVEDSEDSEGGATEVDVLPIVSMDSIERVVARSQSFCLGSSQRATPDSQDRSVADILAALAEEAGPPPSQLSSLEERDSILNHSVVLDENEEKEEEEETLMMSQVEVEDNEIDEAEQALGLGFDVGKLGETWDPGDDAEDIVMSTDDDDDSDEVDLLPQFDGASDKVPGSDNKPVQSQTPDSLAQGVGPSQCPESTSSQQAPDPTASTWRGGTPGRSVASDGPWQQQHGWPQQQQGISDTGPWHGAHSTAWPQQQQFQQPWPQVPSSPGFPSQQPAFPSQQPAFHPSPTMSPSHNPFSSPTHQQMYKTPSPSSSSSHQPFQYSPYQSPTRTQPYRSPSSATIQSPSSTHAFHSPHKFSSSLSQSYHSPTSSQPYSPLGGAAAVVGQLYQLPGSDVPYMSPTSDQPYQSPSVSQPYQPPSVSQPYQSPGYQPSASGHIYSSPYQVPQSSPQQSLQTSFQTPSGAHYPSWNPQGYPAYYQGHTGSQGSFSQSSSGKCPGGPSQLPQSDTFYQSGPAVPSDQGSQAQDLQQPQLQNPALQQQLSQTGATLPTSQPRHKTSQEPISDKPQPRQKRAYRKRKDSKIDIFKPPKSISQSPLSTVSTNPFDFCHQPTASVLSDSFNAESFSFDVDFLHSDSHNISGGINSVENSIQSAGTSYSNVLHPGSVTKISTLEFKPNTQALSFSAASFGAESSGNLAQSPLCRQDDGLSGVGSMKSEMSSSTPMIQQLLMEEPVRMSISKEDRDAFTLKKPTANPTIQKPKRKYTRREGSTGRKPGRPRSTSLTSHVLPASGCYGYSQPAISPPVVGQQRRSSAPFSCDSRVQMPVQQSSSWQQQQQQNVPQTSMWHQHQQHHPHMQWGMNMWPSYGSPGDCNNSGESTSPGLISGRFLHRSFSADTVQASTYGQNSQPDDLQSFFENQTHQQSISSDINPDSIAKEAVSNKSSLSSLLQLVSDVGSDEIAWEGEQTLVMTGLFPHSSESEIPKPGLNLNLNQGSPLVKDSVTLEDTCGQVCERECSVTTGFTSSEESDHVDLDLSGDRKSTGMIRSLSLGNSSLRRQGRLKSLSLSQSHSTDLGSVSDPVDLGCVSDPVDFGCVSDPIELRGMSDPIDLGCMSGPIEPDPTYTYAFHVPTPVFKNLKFFMSEESRKRDAPVVRIHPMDARRYSLLKIGREIVKVVKLSDADLTGHGVNQPPQVYFLSADGSSNRVNLDIPDVSIDRRSGDSGSEENSLSRFDTDFPPNKVAPPSSFHASQVSAAMTMPRTVSANTRSSPGVSDWPRQSSNQQHSTNYNESFGLGLHQGTFGLQRTGPDFVTYSGHHQQVPQSHTSTQFSRQLSEESSGIAYQQLNEKSCSFYSHPAHTPTHPCESYYGSQPSDYAGNSYFQQQYYQHNSQQQSHDFQQQQQPQAAYSGSNREPKNGLRSPGQHGPASRIDSGNTQGRSGDENEDNAEHEGDDDDDSTTDSYPVNTRANAARRENHAEHMPITAAAQDCDAHTNTHNPIFDNRSSTCHTAGTGNDINLGDDTKHKDSLNHFHKKPDTKDKIKKLSLRKSGGVYHFYSPNDENDSNLAKNDVVNHENLADKDVLSRNVLKNSTDSGPGFPNKLNISMARCKKERKRSKRNVKSLSLTIPGQHSVQSFQDSYGDADKESVASSGEESEGTDHDGDDSISCLERRTISVGKNKKGLKTKGNVNKQKLSVNGDYYVVAGTLKRHGAMLVKMNKMKASPREKVEAETCKELAEKDIIRSTSPLTFPQNIGTCTESLGVPNSAISSRSNSSTATRTDITQVPQATHSKTSHCMLSNLPASSNQIFCRPSRGRSSRFGKFRSAHVPVPEKNHKHSFPETSTLASFIKQATSLDNPVNGVGENILHITEDRFFLRFQDKFTKHSARKQLGIEDAAESQKVAFFSGVSRASFHDFQQRFLTNIRKMRSNLYSSSSDDEDDILDKIVLKQKFAVPRAFAVNKPRNSSTSHETRKLSCRNRPQEPAGGKGGIMFFMREACKNKSQNKSRNSQQMEMFLQQDIVDMATTKPSCPRSGNSTTSPSESVLQENINRDGKLPTSQALKKRHLHGNLSEAGSQIFSKQDENFQKCHGISENRTSENRTSEIRTSEIRTSENITSENRTSEIRTSENRTSENRTSEIRTSENRTSESRNSENRTSENRASENRTSGNRTSESRTSEIRTSESRTSENRTSENRISGNITSESRTSESRTSESRTSENRTSENRTSESRTSESRTSENRTSEIRPSENRTSENRTSESRRDAEDKEDYLKHQMPFFEDISSDSDSSNTIILDTFIGGEDTTSQANPPTSGISSPPNLSTSTSDELGSSSTNKTGKPAPSKTTSKKIEYTNLGEDAAEVDNCETYTTNEKILEPEEPNNVLDSVTTKYDGTLSELTQSCHATSQSDFSGKVTDLPHSSPNSKFSHASESPEKELAAENEKSLLKFEEKKIDICFESDEATIELDITSGAANSPSNKQGFDKIHSPKEGEPAAGKLHEPAIGKLHDELATGKLHDELATGKLHEPAMGKQCDKMVDSDHDMDTNISTDILHRPKRHGKGMKKSKRDKGSRLVNRRQLLDDGNSSSNDGMDILSESFAPSKVLRQRKQTLYSFYDMMDSTEEDSSESSNEEFSARGTHRKGSKQNRKQKASGLKDKHLKKLQQNSMDKSSKSGQKSRLSRGKKKKPLAGDKLLNSLSLLHMATLANLSETQPDSLDNHLDSDIAAQSESERSWQYSFRAHNDHSSTFTPSLEHMAFISPQNSDRVEISPPVACSPTDKIKLKQSRGAPREEDITASRRLLNSPRSSSLKPGCNGASNLGSKPLPFSRLVTSTSSSPVPSNFAFNHLLDFPLQQESTIPTDDPSTSGTLHLLETRRAQVNCASFSMRDILRLTTTDDSMDSDSKDAAALVKPPEPKRAQVKSTALSMSDILKLTTTDKTAEARSSPTSYSIFSLLSNSEPSTNTTQKLVKVTEPEVQPQTSQQFLKTLAAFQNLTQKTDFSEAFSQKIDSSQDPLQKTDVHLTSAEKTDFSEAFSQKIDSSQDPLQKTDFHLTSAEKTDFSEAFSQKIDSSHGPLQKTDVHLTSAQKTETPQASAQINDFSQAPAEKTQALSQKIDSSETMTQKTDSSQAMTQKTDSSQAITQKTDFSQAITQKTDFSQAMTQKRDFCHDLPQKTEKSDDLPQKTEKSDDLPQKTDRYNDLPQKTDRSDNLPQKKDISNDLPQKTDALQATPQMTESCLDLQEQKADSPHDLPQKSGPSSVSPQQKADICQDQQQKADTPLDPTQKTGKSDDRSQKTDELPQKTDQSDHPSQKTDINQKTDTFHDQGPSNDLPQQKTDIRHKLLEQTTDSTDISSPKPVRTNEQPSTDQPLYPSTKTSLSSQKISETMQSQLPDLGCHFMQRLSAEGKDQEHSEAQQNNITDLPKQKSSCHLSDDDEDTAKASLKDTYVVKLSPQENEIMKCSELMLRDSTEINSIDGKDLALLMTNEAENAAGMDNTKPCESKVLKDSRYKSNKESGKVAHSSLLSSSEHFSSSSLGVSAAVAEIRSPRSVVPMGDESAHYGLINSPLNLSHLEGSLIDQDQHMETSEVQKPDGQSNRITETQAGDFSLGCAQSSSRSRQSVSQTSSSKPLTSVLEVPRISVTCGEADSVGERFGSEQRESVSRSSGGGGELANSLNVKGSETDLKPLNPLQIPPYPYMSHCLGLQPGQMLHPSLYYPFCWQWTVHTPGSDSLLSPLNLCTIQRSPNNSYSPITPTSPISPCYPVPTRDTASPSMSPPRKKKPLWYPWLTIDPARNKPSPEPSPAHWKTENPRASKFLEKCSNKFSESNPAKKSGTSEKASFIRSQDTGITSSEKEKVFHSKILDLLSSPPIMANSSSSPSSSSSRINSSSCQTISQFLGLVIDTAYEHGQNEATTSPSDKTTDAGTKPLSLKSAITTADGKLSVLSLKSTANEVNKKSINLSPNSVINSLARKRNSSFKNHEFSSDNRNQESVSHFLAHGQIQHLLVTSAHDQNQKRSKIAKLHKMDSSPLRNTSEHQQPRGNRGINKEKSDVPAKSGNYLCTNRKDLTDRLITKLIKGDSHELYQPKPSETAGSQKQPGRNDQPSSNTSQKNTKLENQQLSNSEGNGESGKGDGDVGKGRGDDTIQNKNAKDILSNESGEVTLRPVRLPPSRSLIEENLVALGLNSVQPPVAFCSNPEDLPDRPVEHGGRVLRVESTRLCELPSFASSQHVIGIKSWRYQSLSSTKLLSSQGQGRPLWERLEHDPQLRCLLSGDRPMVASPVRTPPSRKAVSKWLKDRMTGLKGDKTQRANSEIDDTASDNKTNEKLKNFDNRTLNTESVQCDMLKDKKKDETINESLSESNLSYTFISEENNSVLTATNMDLSLLLDTTPAHPTAPAQTSLFPIPTSPQAEPHDQESHQLSSPSLASKNKRKRKLRYSNDDSGDEMKDNPSLDFKTRDKNLHKSKEKSLKSKIPSKFTDSSITSFSVTSSTPLRQSFKGRQQLQAARTDSLNEEQETLKSPERSHDTPRSSQVTEDAAQVSLLTHVSTNTENMLKKSILTSQTQRQASVPGLNDVSQIEGPTPKNTFGFKVAQTHVQDSKALHKYQYVTVMSMELHIETRGNLRPDAEFDSIQSVFYSIFDDIPPERGKQNITGVIISDSSSWSEVAERSRRNNKSPDCTDPATSVQCSAGPSCPPEQSQSLTTDHKPSLGSDMSTSLPGQSSCPDGKKTQTSMPASFTAHHTSSSSSSSSGGTTASSPSQSTPPAGQKKFQQPLPQSSIPTSDKNTPASSARTLLEKCGVDDLKVTYVKDEMELLETFSQLVIQCDPDILVGFEIQMLSWGYILQRAAHLNISLCSRVARVQDAKDDNRFSAEKDEWGADHMSEIHVAGRIVLNLWRILRHEVTLNVYSFENIAYHVLHRRVPTYSFRALTKWYSHDTHLHRWRVIEYYLLRVQGQLELIDQLDLIGKTSEFARVFGIEFYDVLARGSQIRVESMMLRLAKPMNFVPVSPSVTQRTRQKTAECIALNLEPESKYYTSPVAVLDFQSLYPSIMIAYNYCFSTCLGRLSFLQNAHEGSFDFGCTSLNVTASTLQKVRDDVTISPNGIAFIKSSVRRGVLPIMVEEILNTRLMVKKSMKQCKDDKILSRMLDARQLGLKLIANVTYGYTGANFSGRMPCVEVADSIVRKARECLERAIALVEGTSKWRAHVVYGDTDSMFIHFPGRSKDEAFVLGQEIADAVTAMFPSPVKLRFEKVYLPCVLQTKKRYVGFMYETAEQKEPVYDAKGIETVRRDACPAVAKILERSIKILFSTHDLSRVKIYVTQQMTKLLEGKVSVIDLIFAKEFRGMMGYKPGACVPALEIARKRVKVDRRSEPRVGERVPYVIVHGSPGMPLIQLVREPSDLAVDTSLRLNSSYYITKQILPPLNRIFSLIGISVFRWYQEMPKIVRVGPMVGAAPAARQGTISQFFATSNCPICDAQTKQPICPRCGKDPQLVVLALTTMIRNYEKTSSRLAKVCDKCTGTRDVEQSCVSTDCPIMFRRVVAKQDLVRADNLQEVLGKYLQF